MTSISIAPSALVDPTVTLADGVRIWHQAQVREFVELGPNVIIGKGAYVGSGVSIGANSKIQNHALIFEPAFIGRGVFLGPGVILTNDRYPRAVNPDFSQKTSNDWKSVGVTVNEGASLGAGVICVAPSIIGRWAIVAAGALVIADVPDFALVMGVPAKQVGWVGKSGFRLKEVQENVFTCPSTGEIFLLAKSVMREAD